MSAMKKYSRRVGALGLATLVVWLTGTLLAGCSDDHQEPSGWVALRLSAVDPGSAEEQLGGAILFWPGEIDLAATKARIDKEPDRLVEVMPLEGGYQILLVSPSSILPGDAVLNLRVPDTSNARQIKPVLLDLCTAANQRLDVAGYSVRVSEGSQ